MHLLLIIFSLLKTSQGCRLANEEIGYCTSKMNLGISAFCKDSVQPYICMPLARTTWEAYNINYRDERIEDIFMEYIGNQLLSEYKYKNSSLLIISNNRTCYDAYKRFLC